MRVTPEMRERAALVLKRLCPEVDSMWDHEEERDHDLDVIAREVLDAALGPVKPLEREQAKHIHRLEQCRRAEQERHTDERKALCERIRTLEAAMDQLSRQRGLHLLHVLAQPFLRASDEPPATPHQPDKKIR